MGRNRHPEQTLEKIVDVSAELFAKKGYEQTSIQDILDATGLSKGRLFTDNAAGILCGGFFNASKLLGQSHFVRT